jgi:hypothetical protein
MDHSKRNTNSGNILIFLHIPKTAGTTLQRIILRQFSRDSVFRINGASVRRSIDQLKGLNGKEKYKIRLVSGHVPFGLHTCLPRPASYITVLRNPVERIISHYYYVLRKPNHYLHKEVISRKLDLFGYVSEEVSSELNNGQTRAVSGAERLCVMNEHPSDSANVLEIAKRNIRDHFTAVGICERFNESLVLFKRLFGWSNILYARKNVTQERPSVSEIPKQTVRLIERFNELDLELYEHAENVFERMIVDQGESFKRELHNFQKMNKIEVV